ncbi:hypothetical protein Tco_0573306 [Tanacetum coccineum]
MRSSILVILRIELGIWLKAIQRRTNGRSSRIPENDEQGTKLFEQTEHDEHRKFAHIPAPIAKEIKEMISREVAKAQVATLSHLKEYFSNTISQTIKEELIANLRAEYNVKGNDDTRRAKEALDVVTCTFFVNLLLTHVLFDSGSDRSFVSESFSRNFIIPTSRFNPSLDVKVAGSKIIRVANVFQNYEVEINNEKLLIDLIPMPMGEINVVIEPRDIWRGGCTLDSLLSWNTQKSPVRIIIPLFENFLMSFQKNSQTCSLRMQELMMSLLRTDLDKGFYSPSIKMPPYEMLYGRKCRTPICWGEIGQRELAKLMLSNNQQKDRINQRRLKMAQDDKSLCGQERRPIEFQVGDCVMLKVSPWKGVIHFKKRGKLGPHYTGPFRITDRVRKVAYRLQLPEELNSIHNTFHVSQLRKCLVDEAEYAPLADIVVDEKLGYVEEPVKILDTMVKKLRRKEILLFKKRLGRKRARKEQQQESSKRQRIEDDKETDEHEEVEEDDEVELKKHLVIIKDDEIAIDVIPLATKPPMIVEYKLLKEEIMVHYQLIRAYGSSKRYSLMIRMLQDIDREDLETLWKLVKTKHGDIRPEDEHERVLWGDLKVMFEPDIRSEVWRNLQGYTVTVWKLYDSCGVHFVRFGSVHIFMLVEKRYPLTPITITNMLNKKLQTDHFNEMCYQLLKLMIQKMNIKFRGGLLGLKRLQGFLELLLLSTAGTKVNAAGLQLLEDLLLPRG